MLGMCTKIDSDFRDYSDHLHPAPTIAPPPLPFKKKEVLLSGKDVKRNNNKSQYYKVFKA